MEVAVPQLLHTIEQRCLRSGMDELAARRTARHLVASDLVGRHAHGVFRLAAISGSSYSGRPPTHSSRGSFVAVDATGSSGIAAGVAACEATRSHLQAMGSVVVTARGYVGGTGSLGWYAQMLAQEDIVSFIVCNSESAVAVPGTGVPFGGTNPLAIGLPGRPPFVADFASTVVAYGELRMHALAGEPLEQGVVVDADGHPSNLYKDADEGAMLGFGGHKGFALSLAIELLCGYLTGSKIARENDRGDGFVILGLRTSEPSRPDAVAIAKEALSTIVATSHMPGSRLAAVPTAFLWAERESETATWQERQTAEIPDYVVAFLTSRGVELG